MKKTIDGIRDNFLLFYNIDIDIDYTYELEVNSIVEMDIDLNKASQGFYYLLSDPDFIDFEIKQKSNDIKKNLSKYYKGKNLLQFTLNEKDYYFNILDIKGNDMNYKANIIIKTITDEVW